MAKGSSTRAVPVAGQRVTGPGARLLAALLLCGFAASGTVFAAGPATPQNSTISATSGVRVADGVAAHSVTVTARDADNAVVEGAQFAFDITPDDADIVPATCTSASNGVCEVAVTSLVAGAYQIHVTLAGTAVATSPRNLGFIAGLQVAAMSELEVTPGTREADGVDAHLATVTARDINRNLVSGAIVTFEVVGATASALTCTTGPWATCQISITSNRAGVFPVRAYIGEEEVGGSPAPAEFAGGGAVAERSSLEISPGTRLADGIDAHTATIQARDAADQPVAGVEVAFVADVDVQLSAPTCTTTAEGRCVVSLTSEVAGTHAVAASIGGEAVQNSPSDARFIAPPPVAANSRLSLTDGSRLADGIDAHTATATVRDARDNPVPGVEVEFGIGTGAVVSAPRCTTGDDGACRVELTSTQAGYRSVIASVNDEELQGSPASALFVPGPPLAAQSALSVGPGTRIADGVDAHEATATVRDAGANPVSGAVVAFSVSAGADLSSPTCTTGPDGICGITITSTRAGAYALAAALDGAALQNSPAEVVFVAGTADATASTLLVSTGTRVADGRDAHAATATVRDARGNPIGDARVAFTVSDGAGLSSPTCTTGSDGICEIAITSLSAGSYTLAATLEGTSLQGSPAEVVFVAGGADTGASTLTVSAGTRVADGLDAHTATARVLDANANPVSGATIAFAASIGADLSSPTCTTGQDGVCEVAITSARAGSYTLAATLEGVGIQNSPAEVVFVAGGADAAISEMSVSQGTRVADGADAHSVRATVRDARGNAVGAVTVSFSISAGAELSSPTCTTGPDGACEVAITSARAGAYTIAATLEGVGLQNSPAEVVFVAGSADATTSMLTVSVGTRVADGRDAHAATVTVRDAGSNPVGEARVAFNVSGGAELSSSTCTTGPEGGCEVAITSTSAGTYTLAATLDGVGLQGSPADIVFVGGAADATTSTLTVSTGTRVADGQDAHTAAARVLDANANPVSGATIVFAAASGVDLSAPTCTSGADGRCEITVTSARAGAYALTATLEGAGLQGSPAEVVFVAGGADAGASTLTVSAGTRVADGVDAHTAAARVLDANANPVSGAVLAFAASAGADLSAPTCTTGQDGTCEIAITSVRAGSYTLTATLDGASLQGSPAEVAFVAGSADATASTLMVSTGTRVADGLDAHAATASVRDAGGNPVSEARVAFAASAGADLSSSTCTTGDDGACEVAVTSERAGLYSLTATLEGAGLQGSPAEMTFVAGAADANASTLTASAGMRVADGVDAHTARAIVQDARGNPVGGVAIAFTASFGADLSAPTCTTGQDGACEIAITSARAGRYTLAATLDGASLQGSPVDVVFVAGGADATASTLAVSAGTRAADGADVHTATARVLDANANPVGGATIVFNAPPGADLSAPTCTTGQDGTCEVAITSIRAGSYTLMATLDGVGLQGSPADVVFVAGGGDATASTLTVSAGTRVADGAGAHTATTRVLDANANPVGGATIAFTAPPGADLSAPTCTTTQDGACEIAVTSARAGSYTLTATLDGVGLQGSPADVVFVAGGADATASTLTVSAGTRVADGEDAHTATTRVLDANANPVGGAVLAFTVSAGADLSSPTCTTGQDGTCEVAITSARAGSYTLTATLDGVGLQGSPADVVFVAGGGDATASTLTVSAGTRVADGTDAHTATARVLDANANPVGGAVLAFTVSAGADLSSSTCTTGQDGICEVTITSARAGSYTLTATLDGASLQGSPADVVFVAGAADATRSTLSVSAGTRIADGRDAHRATVTAQDSGGNPVGGAIVAFALPAGADLSSPSCTTGVDGTCEITITSTRAGSYALAATLGGVGVQGSPAEVVFVAGVADVATSTLSVSGGTRRADGQDAHVALVRVQDASGNPVSGVVIAFTTSADAALSSSTCTTDQEGACQVAITSRRVGTYALQATLDGAGLQGSPADVVFVAGDADATNSSLSVSTGSRIADGRDAHAAAATVRDASDNPVAGVTIAFAVQAGANLSAASCTTAADGACEVAVTSARAGRYTVTAALDGAALQNSPADVAFVAGAAEPAASTLTISAGTRVADGRDAHAATAAVQDASGNPVGGVAVDFTVSTGAALSAPTCTTGPEGLCEVAITSTRAGGYTLAATLDGNGLRNSPAELVFVAGAADAAASTLTVSTGTRVADGIDTHTAAAAVQDGGGNPVRGAAVAFAVSAGAVLSAQACTTGADGTCEITLTSARAGAYAVTATLDGIGLQNTPAEVVFVAAAADAGNSVVSISAGTRIADGSDAHAVAARVMDARGNPVAGAGVDFAADAGANLAAAACATDAEGRCQVAVTSTVAGRYAIRAALDGRELQSSPVEAVFVAGAAVAANSSLTVSGGDRVADGSDLHLASVIARDGQGNAVPDVAVALNVDGVMRLAEPSCITDANGTCRTLGTSTTAGTFAISATIDGQPVRNSPAAVTFVPDAASAANSELRVTDGNRVADGVDTHTATFMARDAGGNPVAGARVEFSAGDMALSAASCTSGDDGRCQVTLSSTVAGTHEVTATLAGVQVQGSPASARFVAGAADASRSTLAVTEGDRIANGRDAHTASVVVRDAGGNAVGGVTVAFSAAAGAQLSAASCTSDGSGRCEVAVTSAIAGVYAIVATLDGDGLAGSPGSARFVADAASEGNSALSVSAGTRIANGNDAHVVSALVRDAGGNPVAGARVVFGVDAGTALSAPDCVTDPGGRCEVAVTSTVAGARAVSARLADGAIGNSPVDAMFVAGPAEPGNSLLAVSGGDRVADGSDVHSATVIARDANGNPVAGTTISFAVDGAMTFVDRSCVTGADGTCGVVGSSTTPGTFAVSAAVEGGSVARSPAAVTFVANVAEAARSELTVSQDDRIADGVDSHTATVLARDAGGNPVAGARVEFSVPPQVELSAYSCATAVDGLCTVTLTSPQAGTYAVGATIGGAEVQGSPGNIRFVPGVLLSMVKSIQGQPLRVGQPFYYLLTFTNHGATMASQVNFNDQVPVGIRISQAPAGGQCRVGDAAATFPVDGDGVKVLSCIVTTDVAGDGGTEVVRLAAVPLPASAGTTPVNEASWADDGTSDPEPPGPGCQVNCASDGGPDLPVESDDPDLPLQIDKRVHQRSARVGDLVGYTLTVENRSGNGVSGFSLIDVAPPGFGYVDGSLRVDGQPVVADGDRPLRLERLDIAAGQTLSVQYLMRLGAAVRPGTYTNQAQAFAAGPAAGQSGAALSNEASADVVVLASDPLFEQALVFGTVFNDRNGNGFQDEGERGIPGAEVMSVEGLIAQTDRFGRYHLPDVEGGTQERGRNFILKVDPASLPAGSVFTTDNPQLRRITQGMPVRFDFGVRMRDDRP